MLAQASVPWEAHPEVWMLVVGALAIAWYSSRVLQPKAIAAGLDPISRSQKIWFGLGVGGIWLASDWPIHEIAEQHLYSVHMMQHLLLSMLIPAAFVLATPRWVFDLLFPTGSRAWQFMQRLSRPILAGVIFNALTLFLHWSRIVQLSSDNGAIHFAFHLMVFTAGIIMWLPVIGPVHEWRLQPLSQCIYLFCMSIVPTVPGGWLVFAEGVVYRNYDTPDRLWGIDVLTDQQAAGAVMKLVGGFFLWGVIVVIFFKWATIEGERDRVQRKVRSARINAEIRERENAAESPADDAALTFDQVTQVFETTPAPSDPTG